MANNTGIVKSIDRFEDKDGKTVLRVIVYFYDGDCPDLTFGTVWSKAPVVVVEASSHQQSESGAN